MFTSETIKPDIGVIRGQGRLNMDSAPDLRTLILNLLTAGHSRIAVDLSSIDFVDSSGLGVLVSCLRSARQVGGDLRIAAPPAQVSMVLRLSNLDRVLASYDTAEHAYAD